MSFYAYIHASAGVPFYVGKGTRQRAFERSASRRSQRHARKVAKLGTYDVLLLECSDEATAFELERGLIKRLRLMGVDLCNHTEGGEGISGASVAVRAIIAESSRRHHADPDVKARHRAALLAANANPELQERRRKAIKANLDKGGGRPMTGRKWFTKDGANFFARPEQFATLLADGWKAGRLCE